MDFLFLRKVGLCSQLFPQEFNVDIQGTQGIPDFVGHPSG